MKTIAIIGGSRGIGNAILELQLAKNNKVINISRTRPEVSHPNLIHFSCDILTDDLPEVDEIDALVYCPGSINLKPFNRLKIEDFQNDYDINVKGAIKSIQFYLSSLKKGENPSVILFSTVAAAMGMPFHTSIASAKAAVEGLTKSLAADLTPTIRVNSIAPTVTDTDLAAKLLRTDASRDAMKERHPLKKYLNTNEVAEMANFLMSENASSITGQIIKFDCGIVTLKM